MVKLRRIFLSIHALGMLDLMPGRRDIEECKKDTHYYEQFPGRCELGYRNDAQIRERVYDLEEAGHDPTDRAKAIEKAFEWGDKIPIGVIFKAERPPLDELVPALAQGPLAKQSLERDIRPFMERFI